MGYLIQLSQHGPKEVPDLTQRMKAIFKDRVWTMAYVGSQTDKTGKYYQEVVEHFKQYGSFQCTYYDFDEKFDPEKNQAIFKGDVIYLSGGRTPYFLDSLRKHDVLKDLRAFYQRGGIIIGLSAGAIILSETIDVVSLWNPDYKPVQEIALGLVDHDFIPHWPEDRGALTEVKAYSLKSKKIVYLCEDGAGIIKAQSQDRVELYGISEKITCGLHERLI